MNWNNSNRRITTKGANGKRFLSKSHPNAIEQLTKALEKRKEIDAKALEDAKDEFHHAANEIQRKANEEIQTLRKQQVEEIQDKQKQIRDISKYMNKLESDKGEQLSSLQRDYDSNLRAETRRLNDAYETNLSHLKDHMDSRENHYGRLNAEAIKDKEAQYENRLKIQAKRHIQKIKDGFLTLKTLIPLKLIELKNNEKTKKVKAPKHFTSKSTRLMSSTISIYKIKHVNTLKVPRDSGKSDQEIIGELQKALQTQRTTQDTTLISPAQESSNTKLSDSRL